MSKKLFSIRSQQYSIFTGITLDGYQIMSTEGVRDKFLGIYFNKEGKFIKYNTITNTLPRIKSYTQYNPAEFWETISRERSKLLNRLGFLEHQTIRVEKFLIPEHLIGILEYPISLWQQGLVEIPELTSDVITQLQVAEKLLEDQQGFSYHLFDSVEQNPETDLDEIKEDQQFLRNWVSRGDCVLLARNDYWCDIEGRIIAS